VRACARALQGFDAVHDVSGEASVAFSCPARGEWALGFGVAAEWGTPVEWDGPSFDPPGPWFGGLAFDEHRPWSGFPSERWVLPEVLVWARAGQLHAAAFGRECPQFERRARRGPAAIVGVRHERATFASLVDDAVAALRTGALEKVVCARRIEVEAAAAIDPRTVLEQLEARFPSCWSFLFRGSDGSTFVGASPETLCDVDGDRLTTEALAGSSPPGQERALLASAKDQREHALVVAGIREALTPLAVELHVAPGPAVRVLPYISHLHTPISARLKRGVAAMDAARALHPTPAVCGTPRATAREWLARHEGFPRGWYAGAVGTRGDGRLHLAVGLRCARLEDRHATVYAGAGIVEGSTAAAELLETDRKARPLLEALGAPVGGGAP
jgi:salicylate biosynthesis isochorismate synthase